MIERGVKNDGFEYLPHGFFGRRYYVGITSVKRRCVSGVGAFVLTISGGAGSAEQTVEHQTNAALSAFYGFCLTSDFDATKVAALALDLGWKKLPEDQMNLFVPRTEVEYKFFDGYLLMSPDDPPVPMVAFSGLENKDREALHHCSLFFQDVLVSEFASGFIEDSGAGLVSKNGPIGAVVEFYQLAEFPESLVLIESEKRNPRGLRASFLTKKHKG